MNIQEIVNEHSREIIKSIFSKLDDEEKYVILELNNQLQDKINKIDKAIEYIKENKASLPMGRDEFTCEMRYSDDVVLAHKLLEILGDKENENNNI